MRLYSFILLLCLIPSGGDAAAQDLEPLRVIELSPYILEPSDLCLHPDGESLLIVSDKGFLYHTDLEGTVLERALFRGRDFEGIYAHQGMIYVADESERLVHLFDPQGLVLLQTYLVPYRGKRNSGYESITYNRSREVFILITEKNPVIIFELDGAFQVRNSIGFSETSDISAATWHANHLWLVSDEERAVLKLDPKTYEVVGRWSIPSVKKPEGIVFLDDATMLVVCDREHKLYYFTAPR